MKTNAACSLSRANLSSASARGTYRVPRRGEIEVVRAAGELLSAHANTDTLLSDPVLCGQTERVTVSPFEAVIRLQDGAFDCVVSAGEHLFWKEGGSFLRFDTTSAEIAADVPLAFVEKWAPFLLVRTEVKDGEMGKLYFDNKFVRMLEPGKYLFWANGTQVSVKTYCMRPQLVDVGGQEILTRDKVGVRINFTFCYRLTDAERAQDASDIRSCCTRRRSLPCAARREPIRWTNFWKKGRTLYIRTGKTGTRRQGSVCRDL